ncbi:complex I NDUFA5 subunit family protein [Ascoidea rubescens DSM 1968]|uniref:Putative NADH-ubiquinone oxidoreductase n=1 Tax=Ascoidea rubescens DSM 1968 TaxID=1344418 RepID=A0A1D2VSI7_9ASCO|nr:putative NADH-ubiquinone oxidoreductase [Ascoidea rubescens DSM 1968]ODV64559.1 putative NADH-ubiquinone oxidoreductase [Ascoidea rubescens DSM 1968]
MRFFPVLRQAARIPNVLVQNATHKGYPTGLAGLQSHPDPRPALISIYKFTLDYLKENFPKNSVYRQSTENFTKKRLEIVEGNEIVEKIETQINDGLIEELVINAANEFELAQLLAKEKCWEELQEKPLPDQWTYFGKEI